MKDSVDPYLAGVYATARTDGSVRGGVEHQVTEMEALLRGEFFRTMFADMFEPFLESRDTGALREELQSGDILMAVPTAEGAVLSVALVDPQMQELAVDMAAQVGEFTEGKVTAMLHQQNGPEGGRLPTQVTLHARKRISRMPGTMVRGIVEYAGETPRIARFDLLAGERRGR